MAYGKRHESCTLFLEAGFGTQHRQKLIDAGFGVVCFADDFPEEVKNRLTVSDPRIIRHCFEKKFVLFTLDKNMRYTHVEEIKKTDIAIIATESSDKFSSGQWVDALIRMSAKVRRKVKRFPRPWLARLTIRGDFRSIVTITSEMKTRRDRPLEQASWGDTEPDTDEGS